MTEAEEIDLDAMKLCLSPGKTHIRKSLHGYNICSFDELLEDEDRDKYAVLLVSAPKLLHALEDLLTGIEACREHKVIPDPHSPICEKARAVIAYVRDRW